MIVRILGEGQYDGPRRRNGRPWTSWTTPWPRPSTSSDEAGLRLGPGGPHRRGAVRGGQPLADDAFTPSDLVVPFADATLEETKALLAEPGGHADGRRRPLRTPS